MKPKKLCDSNKDYAEAGRAAFCGGFLFSDIATERAKQICSSVTPQINRFKKGDVIMERGSAEARLGIILAGRALVCRISGDRRLILRHMESGSFFGASSLFGGEVFPTDIVADTECTVATLSEHEIESLLRADPQVAMNYIRFLSGRIRFLNDSIDSYSIRSAEEKISKFILQLCNSGVGRVDSYTRMADQLGIGRASLYRALDSFERSGLIVRRDKLIEIADRDRLYRIANKK